MTFQQIMYFLAIVEQKKFSYAADKMFISQSSLSKQIKAIENELGVTLFCRNNYQIKLTEAGKKFLPFAIKFSRDYSDMVHSFSDFCSFKKSVFTVKVGSIPILCYPNLTNQLVKFGLQHQNIYIEIFEREQSELLKMLELNQIDFAIVRIDHLSSESYDFIPLSIEQVGILCSYGHNLAIKKIIALRDLANETFGLLNNTSSLHQLCIDACRHAGFDPKVNFLSTRHELLLTMVSISSNITMLPINLLNLENSQKIKFIPLREPLISTIGLISKKKMKNNPQIYTFQSLIKEYFINVVPHGDVNEKCK